MINIDLYAFASFGNPNGYKQKLIIGKRYYDANKVKLFDLETNAICLYPDGHKLYSIRTHYVYNEPVIAFSIYKHIREKNSNRGGTFIGASLLFYNYEVPNLSLIIEILDEFLDTIINDSRYVQNNTILINHSDQFQLKPPARFNDLSKNTQRINHNFKHGNKESSLVVYKDNLQINDLVDLVSNSFELLDLFDDIYFTSSIHTYEYVRKSGLFKNISSKEKLVEQANKYKSHLAEEKRIIIEKTIKNLEDYIVKLKIEKEKYIPSIYNIIREQDKTINELKIDLQELDKLYKKFIEELEKDVTSIKTNNKVPNADKIHKIKDIITDKKSIIENKSNKIRNNNRTVAVTTTASQSNTELNKDNQEPIIQPFENNRNVFKGTTLLFAFLFFSTLIYFLFFNSTDTEIDKVSNTKTEMKNEDNNEEFSKNNNMSDSLILTNIFKDNSKQKILSTLFKNLEEYEKNPDKTKYYNAIIRDAQRLGIDISIFDRYKPSLYNTSESKPQTKSNNTRKNDSKINTSSSSNTTTEDKKNEINNEETIKSEPTKPSPEPENSTSN